jgi:hypothetical protein
MQPPGLYNLLGYNCEQAANFCSTNSYESYQVRGYFAARSLIGLPLILLAFRRRPRSARSALAAYAWIRTGVLSHHHFYWRGERFMREVGRPLLDWERQQP